MAFGIAAPGRSPEHHAQEGRFRSLDEYRQLIRENVRQGLVDIMLMSASTNEVLTIARAAVRRQRRHAGRAGQRRQRHLGGPGRRLRCGNRSARSAPPRSTRRCAASPAASRASRSRAPTWASTPSPSTTTWPWTTARWRPIGRSARRRPPRTSATSSKSSIPTRRNRPCPDLARFVNDMIVRTLAGVAGKARPLFLKIVYHGPAAMEQLAGYDSRLIVGILGGSSGTTFDAFQQLWEAKKYGARAALYGRMINNSEHQLSFIEHLRGAGRRPSGAPRGGAIVPCRLAAVEDPALSQPGRRPASHAPRERLWRRRPWPF